MNQTSEGGAQPVATNWWAYWIGATTIVVLYLIAVNSAPTIWPQKMGRRAVSPDGLYTATIELSSGGPLGMNCDVRLRLTHQHRFLGEFYVDQLDDWSDFRENSFRLNWISNNELHIGDRDHRIPDAFRLKVQLNSLLAFEH